jgi:hypothetical protein
MYSGKSYLAPYCNDWDFRYKNMASYFAADLFGSTAKAPFEVRKQLI